MFVRFDELSDIARNQKDYVDARISDVEAAAKRSRWVYPAITVVSLLLVAMAYNTVLSWSRAIADTVKQYGDRTETWTDELAYLILQRWVDSLHFDVPLLGAKFSASDAGIVGGVLLMFMATICLFSARRENHLVYYLVRDAELGRASWQLKMYLRTHLSATQVFSRGWHDEALAKQDLINSDAGKVGPKRREDKWLRRVLLLVFYLPAIALLLVLAADIWSLNLPSPIRRNDESLWLYLVQGCSNQPEVLCSAEIAVLIRLVASLVLVFIVAVVMHRAYGFQRATSELLAYTERWMPDVTRKNSQATTAGVAKGQPEAEEPEAVVPQVLPS